MTAILFWEGRGRIRHPARSGYKTKPSLLYLKGAVAICACDLAVFLSAVLHSASSFKLLSCRKIKCTFLGTDTPLGVPLTIICLFPDSIAHPLYSVGSNQGLPFRAKRHVRAVQRPGAITVCAGIGWARRTVVLLCMSRGSYGQGETEVKGMP